jgi:hypothetical protein
MPVSKWIEAKINDPATRFHGRVMTVFTFLGVCVWAPSLAAAVGFPWAYAAFPLGMVLGPLVGACVAPLLFTEPTDEPNQEADDVRD